jgi:hypothetical protein
MAMFLFRLDSFTITQTMAKRSDTDWVYFTVRVGDQVLGPRHEKVDGDLNNGTFLLNWDLGPVEVAPDALVMMTYQIVNHGHADTEKQVSDDLSIAAGIAAGIALVPTPASAALAVISGVLAGVGQLANWLFGDGPNCDGVVLSDAISMNAATLLEWTQESGMYSESQNYTGPETPHGCGPDAEYSVSWSVHRVDSGRSPFNRALASYSRRPAMRRAA